MTLYTDVNLFECKLTHLSSQLDTFCFVCCWHLDKANNEIACMKHGNYTHLTTIYWGYMRSNNNNKNIDFNTEWVGDRQKGWSNNNFLIWPSKAQFEKKTKIINFWINCWTRRHSLSRIPIVAVVKYVRLTNKKCNVSFVLYFHYKFSILCSCTTIYL